MEFNRRKLLTGLAATIALPFPAHAASITDGAGRSVAVPARVARVFPAGPPAAIMLYTAAPDLLLGWPRANRPAEREFLLPDVGSRPEVGRVTGRGNTANLEAVLALKPDLILDIGSVNATYVSLADRVQEQTGIPYALLDGRFDGIAATYRMIGALIGRRRAGGGAGALRRRDHRDYLRPHRGDPTRASAARLLRARAARTRDRARRLDQCRDHRAPGAERRRRYPRRSWQCLDRAGAAVESGGDRHHRPGFRGRHVYDDRAWAPVAAVHARRVHLSPKLPFGWVDFPPSVNRLIGLWWLAKILYPDRFPEDLRALSRDFYTRFYHVTPNEAQIDRVLAGRD